MIRQTNDSTIYETKSKMEKLIEEKCATSTKNLSSFLLEVYVAGEKPRSHDKLHYLLIYLQARDCIQELFQPKSIQKQTFKSKMPCNDAPVMSQLRSSLACFW